LFSQVEIRAICPLGIGEEQDVKLLLFVVAFFMASAPSAYSQELKFDCTGKVQQGDVPMKQWPSISAAELSIDLTKKELLMVLLTTSSGIYGKIVDVTDTMIRFRSKDGYGGIDRTTGEFMSSNPTTDTTHWLKCKLRKQLF
jgi:hypothetical protein